MSMTRGCGPSRRTPSVFENLVGTKKIQEANPLHFIKFKKIQRNSEKFDRNAFDERKEHDFFKTRKSAELADNSAEHI
jgi:hypothetical protein